MDENSFNESTRCRLCDNYINEKECHLLYEREKNLETKLGRKANLILNSSAPQLNLSQYCCNACASKIEICFRLLIEIQTSDEIIRETYKHGYVGPPITTVYQIYSCADCKVLVKGYKTLLRHIQNHFLKTTGIDSNKDVKVPHSVLSSDDDLKQSGTINFNSCKPATKKDVGDNIYLENDEINSYNKLNIEQGKKKRKHYGNIASSETQNLSSDEFSGKKTDPDPDLETAVSETEFAVYPDRDRDGSHDGFIDKGDEISDSDVSMSSETSYNNLVGIVKRELEKSDSDYDTDLEITVNEDGNYYCCHCDQTFQYKFLLVHHLKSGHNWKGIVEDSASDSSKTELEEDDDLVKCSQCHELFRPCEIFKHVQGCWEEVVGSGDVLCHACGKMVNQKEWPAHKKKHVGHAGTWGCELCGKRFKAKRILRSHLGEHDESKKKVCEICGKKLLPLSFFSHMMKHKEKRHVCQFCGKGFTYNYGLRLHLKVHQGSERIVSKPGKKRDKIFCWLCKKDFESSSTLHNHLKNEHNIEGAKQDSRFACSQCDKKFADMFGLKAHLKLIHEMTDEVISRFKSLPVYRYIECNVCNQVFNSENKVRIHMKQDHGLKPFEMEILKKECEKCGKRFASKQNLIHHINGAHLNIKPMQCDICNERFAKHSSLIYHKLRHSGEKPFQCEYCHKTYRQRNDVIRHLARHVRDKELTLEEASATNNSSSPLVLKRRIFLKDSSISFRTLMSRNRRQRAEIVEVDSTPAVETKVEYDEGSYIYVEEVLADDIQQPESPKEVKYMTVKPVYNEERNTIILSSPELFKNAMENINYRYVTTAHAKDIPAVIVKKETDM